MWSTILFLFAAGTGVPCVSLPLPCAPRSCQEGPAAKAASAVLADLPLDLHIDRYLYARGTLNGVETDIVLDTGAGMTVVDAALADEIGLEGVAGGIAQGVGGEGRPIRLGKATVGLGELELDLSVAILDLQEVAERLGRRMPVILGKELFRAHPVTVDYLARRLLVWKRGAYDAPPEALACPAKIRGDGHVKIQLEFEDLGPEWFLVDTGSGDTLVLHTPYVKKKKLLSRYERLGDRRVGGVGGTLPVKSATAARVLLAGHEFSDVPVTLSIESAGAFSDSWSAGNLGSGLLRRFRVTFDYPARRLLFEPGPDLDAAFEKDRSGLILDLVAGEFHVIGVSPGSPADDAGFEAGVVLAALDGEEIPKGGIMLLRTKLRQPAGTPLVVRDAGGKEFSIELADYY